MIHSSFSEFGLSSGNLDVWYHWERAIAHGFPIYFCLGICCFLCRKLGSCLCNLLHMTTIRGGSSLVVTWGTPKSNFLLHLHNTIHTLASRLHSHPSYIWIVLPYDELYLQQLPLLTVNRLFDSSIGSSSQIEHWIALNNNPTHLNNVQY